MSDTDTKKALRRRFLAARDALDPHVRHAKSLQVCAIAAAVPHLSAARAVGLYAPVGSEVDVEPLIAKLVAAGVIVALPRMRADKRLDFVPVRSLANLISGTFGVREPVGPTIALTQLDLVMAPGLAFGPEGRRLGYGGGYYDRTLLGYTREVIGIAFSQQVHAGLPVAPHDRPVGGIVTELGFAACPASRPGNSGQTRGPVAP